MQIITSLRNSASLLLFVFAFTSLAEPIAPNNIQLRHISKAQGLSQNTVNDFYEDNQGFIWISTEAGINRFDGESMLTLDGDNNRLRTAPVSSIVQDSSNNLWINTYQGLVYVNQDQTAIHRSHFPSEQKHQISANIVIGSLEVDPDNMWVFTWNGIYNYKLDGRDITQLSSMSVFHSKENNLLSFKKDGDVIWLGSTQGLYLFTPNERSIIKVPILSDIPQLAPRLDFRINSINQLEDKQLVISSNRGLFLIDMTIKKEIKVNQVTKEYVSDVWIEEGLVYFSSLKDIKIFDPMTLKVSDVLSLPEILPQHSDYKIKTIFIDSKHLLWIGTFSQGAYIWDTQQRSFKSWNTKNKNSKQSLTHETVWSIDESTKNHFWIGTEAGLDFFDLENNQITSKLNKNTPNTTIENLKVYDLLEASDKLWLATGNGLVHFNLSDNTIKSYLPSFKRENQPFRVFSLVSVRPDEIWLATNLGVLKFDVANHIFSYEKHIMPRINAKPTRLLKYKDNLLWVGLNERLITYSLDKKQKTTILNSEKNAKGSYSFLMDIYIESDRVWVSYKKNGIYIVETKNGTNKVIKHLHSANGFPDNNIYSLQNSNGYMWASSTQGLIRIDPKTYEHVVFDHRDGLVSNEFNEGAALKTKQGYLLYGGPSGLTKIDLQELKISETKPQPTISRVEVKSNEETITRSLGSIDALTINNSQSTVYLSFSTLDYLNPNSWHYEYWLEGEKQTQPRITQYPEVTLSDLPNGKTVFNLRSVSIKNGSKSDTVRLNIVVSDRSFFTIPKTAGNYVLVLFIIAWFLYRRHVAKISAQALYNQIEENEKRMELALFDDRRGIWDCLIDQDNVEKSTFIIYQNKKPPLTLTLENYFALVHPTDIAHAKSAWIEFSIGKKVSFFETYRSNFNQRWVWNRIYGKVNEYYSSGHPKRATGIWTDINQEKKIEDKLNLYSHAFQSTQDLVFILDNNLIVTVVNQAYENSTGFSGENLVGRSMVDIAFSRFTEKETQRIKKQVQQNKRWRGESSVPRRHAPSFPVNIRINVITTNNIDSGYVVVMTDVSKRQQQPAFETSFYDQLTGLPNKVLAFDRLRLLLGECIKSNHELSIIFLSIDHFAKLKSFLDEDSFNNLITKISNRLLPYIQKNDVLARYEPDTFIAIIKHSGDGSDILHTVNQLLKEVSKTFFINEQPIDISACAGISSYPDDGSNWSELITKAETALAQTRQQGENLFKYYHEDSNKKALERVGIENRLQQAINARELFLVYQPLLDFKTMKTVELDVNLRWQMEDNRTIYPSQFLPLSKKIGMLNTLSEWLINQAFSSLKRWNQEGLKIYFNINLSVDYLLETGTVEYIKEKLELHRIEPNVIFIAINEHEIGSNVSKIVKITNELSAIGVQLVLDGFGKSSASLQNLQKLKFHSVKLDRTLIRNINDNKFNDRVLQGIISLINDVQLGSVARGVETEEQLAFLIKNKCRYGQGFLFSDPLIESQMRQYLLDKH